MSKEQNKALMSRVIKEVFNQGKTSPIDELFAPGFVEHEELPPGIAPGREGVKQISSLFRSAFPDLKVKIDDTIVDGDKVVIRCTWSGTHKGEFMGIPQTGRSVSFGVIDIVRIAGDKIVEHWGQMDTMRMMQQLGAGSRPAA
jgi:predicted ester cyclase